MPYPIDYFNTAQDYTQKSGTVSAPSGLSYTSYIPPTNTGGGGTSQSSPEEDPNEGFQPGVNTYTNEWLYGETGHYPISETPGGLATLYPWVYNTGYNPGNVPGVEFEDTYFGYNEQFPLAYGQDFNPQSGGYGYYGGGGYGGGGGGYTQSTGYQPSDINWTIGDYSVGEGSPDWWKPMIPTDMGELNNPLVAYTLMQNALIGSGTLSDEDARASANQLATMWSMQKSDNPWELYSLSPDEADLGTHAGLIGGAIPSIFQPAQSAEQAAMGFTAPQTLDEGYFQSAGRANEAVTALDNMVNALGGGEDFKFGPGYEYLRSIASATGSMGNEGKLTRQQAQDLRGVMDPLMSQAGQGSELGPFAEMARMIFSPFLTNAPPRMTRTPSGAFMPGERNPRLSF